MAKTWQEKFFVEHGKRVFQMIGLALKDADGMSEVRRMLQNADDFCAHGAAREAALKAFLRLVQLWDADVHEGNTVLAFQLEGDLDIWYIYRPVQKLAWRVSMYGEGEVAAVAYMHDVRPLQTKETFIYALHPNQLEG